ncbi:putative uncharacterized protein [Helicobacter pylori]|nr:putative uncharacterized protein [Helicobacter pylori]
MKGISLIKIKFKGYALEFNKKIIPQNAMKIKKGLKTTNPRNAHSYDPHFMRLH